jgi:hypothetical protein
MSSIPGGLHYGGVRRHAEYVPDVLADTFSGLQVIQLNLHRNVATNDVQSSGEPQNRRQLRKTVTGEV